MKTPPMSQQRQALARSEGKRNFAYFMEQGTGKTWTLLADAERAFIANKIDALLVIAPNGVHTNWVLREIPTHLECDSVCFAWPGQVSTKKEKAALAKLYARHFEKPTLRIFTINFDAFVGKKAREFVEEFLRSFRVMVCVDESKKIGNPKAKRTETIIELGRMGEARRILSGKPLTKAPTDLFSQFDFLKPGLLGTTSYRAFVAEYSVLLDPGSPQMQGLIRKMGPKAVYAQINETDENGNKKWRNLDKLAEMCAPHMFRIRKDECLDLPPKVYKQVFFELDNKQRGVYDLLKEEYEYTCKEDGTTSFQAIAARSKMKQVTSGFININGEPKLVAEGDNPRLKLLRELLEDEDRQFLIWSIYKQEIDQITGLLKELGISFVEYHGGVSTADRERAVDDFQAGKAQAFVCNSAAYAGLTLTAATLSIYYSCNFDNDVRAQSEDRCHRIGTKSTVVYIDIIAAGTIDEDVQRSLHVKNAIADHVIDGRELRI